MHQQALATFFHALTSPEGMVSAAHNLAQVIGRLPEKQRVVLDLVADGLTSKEIARMLGISPKTVDHRLYAARQHVGPISRRELMRLHRELGIDQEPVPETEPAETEARTGFGKCKELLRSGRFWLGFATGMSVGLSTYLLTHVTLFVLLH